MEVDEGVASVNGSSSTTAAPLTLPKIPVVAPGKGEVLGDGGRGSYGVHKVLWVACVCVLAGVCWVRFLGLELRGNRNKMSPN